ncbi:hypothetical protein ABEX25_22545 [Paenibacillus thiaminolyticus]|uniref:hypothetical protein n=1 Tax=Paenibacillus thiaminolyticus TaxID=49283 RepID=UPI003D2720F7
MIRLFKIALSTPGKNYVHRFRSTGLFEGIFRRILEEAARYGFLETDVLFIDATHVKASTNKNKYVKEIVQEQSRKYQDQLDEEINKDRVAHGFFLAKTC